MSESAALVLRKVRPEDLPVFFAHGSDPQAVWMAAFTAEDPTDHDAFMARWQRILADPTVAVRTIDRGGAVLGHVLSYRVDGRLEVSYWVGREYWGEGVAGAALEEFLRTVATDRPVHARVAADNGASRRVLERSGFRVIERMRGFANARGEEIDEVLMELSGDLLIRPERRGDEKAIGRVVAEAFRTAAHADGTEHRIVDALRTAGALTVSLVAERADRLVGHVAFSPVGISDGAADWYGLGPVAVLPDAQGEGVGTALIRRGLGLLRERGAAGCVVLGDPGYYGRFGFRSGQGCELPGVPPEYFQSLLLGERPARGTVTYHEAFGPA